MTKNALTNGNNIGKDISASIIVFLVALPLCLGVALASKFDNGFTGIIAGIVGGIIVGIVSKSPLSVTGPAAGLTAIVGDAIINLPKEKIILNGVETLTPIYGAFFLAVLLAGVLQLILSFLKAGVIGNFIPNTVIKGMLAGIGLILILKQIPHFLGRDTDPEGDETFVETNGENTFTSIYEALKHPTQLAIIIGIVGVLLLILWERKFFKKNKLFSILSGPLMVVVIGTAIALFLKPNNADYLLENEHYVKVNVAKSASEFFSFFKLPRWEFIGTGYVWKYALTLAIVASLETLLSIEAVDKMDPLQRFTPTNRELLAQGTGNIISGLIGGLPVTSVIVRSSANVNAGATSKLSTIFHGVLLLLAVAFIPTVLNLIPKAALAAILIMTGYKLIKPSIFKDLYKKGYDQLIPFVVTIVAILVTDLLKGVCIGFLVSLYFILKSNYRKSITLVNNGNDYLVLLANEVSFLNKLKIDKTLAEIPDSANVIIDCSQSHFLDYDIQEAINDFINNAHKRNIEVEIKSKHSQKYIFVK
jgi:MFS superfamily sulfate permease-like transporter